MLNYVCMRAANFLVAAEAVVGLAVAVVGAVIAQTVQVAVAVKVVAILVVVAVEVAEGVGNIAVFRPPQIGRNNN